ncbi:glutathione S-transferase family protein [Acetobacteraceae bacterium ESL0709]|nr:glutathione S-transferase family protein [Acetobacteraceae bacterium ESL0697]MDF7678790.1 glutathione S-transferase family protein [Acetobacteraceae bacterium ESL0709]
MYKLYAAYGTMGLPAHITLEALNVPYEIKYLDLAAGEQKSPEYLKINPNGRVPALVLEDGQVIYESSAVLLTLADAHPEAGLSPRLNDPRRPIFLQWMFFLTNSLQDAMLNSHYPARLVGDVSEEVSGIVSKGAMRQAKHYLEIIEDYLAQHGPYFLGDKVSVADFHFSLCCRALRSSSVPPRSFPHIAGLLDKIDRLPYVQRALKQEHLEGPLA